MRLRDVFVVVALVSLAAGCGAKDGFIYGKILDARTGETVMGATVTLGDAEVSANEQGFFTMGEVKPDEAVLLKVRAAGYARSVKPVVARSGKATYIEVSMLPFVGTSTFDVAAGGSVSGEGAQVTFPAGSLDASGTVTANLAVLDASSMDQLRAFPGDFSTDRGDRLESFGAIAIEVTDDSGRLVNLASGAEADVAIPSVNAPGDVPLWSFDEEAGVWKEEGSLSGCETGTCGGTIPHLSWWNADQVMETTCLTMCVEDVDGNPVEGAALEGRGVDYNGLTEAYTGRDGCACVEAKRGGQVEVVGLSSGGVAGPVAVTAQSSVAACGGDCQEVSEHLVLTPPLFQATLTWGEEPSDLDSHLVGPCSDPELCYDGSFHVYYGDEGSISGPPWAYLDTDDTTSYGPEITSIVRAEAGTYRYAIHNYSESPNMAVSGAEILLFLPNGGVETVRMPDSNPNDFLWWDVGELTCKGAAPTRDCAWKTVNRFVADSDAPGR